MATTSLVVESESENGLCGREIVTNASSGLESLWMCRVWSQEEDIRMARY